MKDTSMLTGLRGIAALIVFVSHCANEGLLPGFMGNGLGQIGVVIFFVLSGFLMAYLYLDKGFDVHSVGRYIQARVARVVPLYLAIIILSFVISNSVYPDFHYSITDPKILVRAFLFIDAPYEFWTIPVEMQFYGVFILFWFLYQLGVKKILLATFIVLTAVPSVIYLFLKGGTLVLFSTYSCAFFTGVITAILYDKIVSSPACRLFAKYSPVPLIILFVLNMPGLRFDYGWVLSDNLFA
ncbi:MAG: acyltransferase, partial [Gammaproteobacteria bacterium]